MTIFFVKHFLADRLFFNLLQSSKLKFNNLCRNVSKGCMNRILKIKEFAQQAFFLFVMVISVGRIALLVGVAFIRCWPDIGS